MDIRRANMGRALREIRDASGLFAKDVANKAGLSASYLSEMENGVRAVSAAAVEKLAPVFRMEAEVLDRELSRRAEQMSRGIPNLLGSSHAKSGESSAALHEDPGVYRVPMKPSPDSDALLRHLVANMTRAEMFALLREFTQAAEKGDASAFAKARALFDLIPPDAPPPLSPSG